ncbi:hypothetical protein L873DRAFT_1834312 [Choiromyces venosus 120613-1]|uniref:Tafazzin n=1 Tax=Choiromyces venosus 120613-1 TaxID=1336337 RepID=A0A3N4K179_9PEZI|nr:hypothetical protein L873DRAFT_1834312 [Choiromyces venosus 120613-1]
MAKKHKPKFPKPTPDAHSYFKKSPAEASSAAGGRGGDTSVNSILAKLRSGAPGNLKPLPATPSVPPVLQELLGAEPSPPPPARRVIIGAGVGGRMRGRIPGPPPPASWLHPERQGDDDQEAIQGSEQQQQLKNGREGIRVLGVQHPLSYLPGMATVNDRQLLHYALKAMALRWEEHVVYDQHWLQYLPPNVKTLLLSYIATYTPAGVTLAGLKVLFKAQDEDITTLDLSRSLSSELTLPRLAHFIRPNKRSRAEISASWEDELDDAQNHENSAGKGYAVLFPSLTHLSLAHPALQVSPRQLLAFTASIPPTITHLSLAGWACHAPDGMRRLVRNLLGLKWLDVSNCHWLLYEQLKDAEWCGPWRNVETVVARQNGDVLPIIKSKRYEKVRELKRVIRELRHERGGKWCNVVFDEDKDKENISL